MATAQHAPRACFGSLAQVQLCRASSPCFVSCLLVPPYPPVTRQPVQVRPGVGESWQALGPTQPLVRVGPLCSVQHSCPCTLMSVLLLGVYVLTWLDIGLPTSDSGWSGCWGHRAVRAWWIASLGPPLSSSIHLPNSPLVFSSLGGCRLQADMAPLPLFLPGYQHQVQPTAGGPNPHHGA